MISKKLKTVLSSIFSSALLFLTFGVSSAVPENKSFSSDQKVSVEQTDKAKTPALDELKARIQADYRANINKFESSAHAGRG